MWTAGFGGRGGRGPEIMISGRMTGGLVGIAWGGPLGVRREGAIEY